MGEVVHRPDLDHNWATGIQRSEGGSPEQDSIRVGWLEGGGKGSTVCLNTP